MSWSRIAGTAADIWAIAANRLFMLRRRARTVSMYDLSSGTWREVQGPGDDLVDLIGGAWDLYAISLGGHLFRYDGKDWKDLGESSGTQHVGICNALYTLRADGIHRYDRYSGTWKPIGGPATARVGGGGGAIVGGGSKVHAAAPANAAIWEYSRYLGTWQKIGGPGAMWAGVGGTVYGLSPDKNAVYRYDGTPGRWTKVGGPASSLIGGGSCLYATEPGTGKLLRYSGQGEQWEDLRVPQVQPDQRFIAVGRTVFAMVSAGDGAKIGTHQLNDESAESKRLRALLGGVYDEPEYGNRVTRGFLVKSLGQEVLAEHFSDVCFQPLSTLKLLPYLHALIEVDAGNATLAGTRVSWVQPTSGTTLDVTDGTCIPAGTPNTRIASAPLADALPTMMWESHNRTLDAVLDRFGPANITARVQELGLRQTEMYFGCMQPGSLAAPWLDNVSTLIDIARVFEGVESLDFVTSPATREAFRHNMIVLDAAPGTSYRSPITGRTSGPLTNEYLRAIVASEAGPARSGLVSDFMKYLVVRGKGGGFLSDDETAKSDFVQVTLPFKRNGAIVPRRFVLGWYYCQMRRVMGPPQPEEDKKLEAFRLELFRLPIRRALETW